MPIDPVAAPSDDTAADRMRQVATDRVAALVDPQPDLLGLAPSAARDAVVARRAAGRPAGSRNRRLEDAARFVVEHIGDPLLMLAQLAMMPADELAVAARCSAAEALAEKRLAAIAVLPFLHRKQPIAVDVTTRTPVYLTLIDTSAPAASPESMTVEVVTYQEVIDGDYDAV